MVCATNFSLQEAMSALELMDPKMDEAMQEVCVYVCVCVCVCMIVMERVP
jgi:hypothetical protein